MTEQVRKGEDGDERCRSAQMLLQWESFARFRLFFFTISCVWLREQTPDDEGNSQPSGIQSHTASSLVLVFIAALFRHHVQAHISEAQTLTANERTIGLPLGRYAYTRNSIYITLNTITVVYFMFSVLFLYI